MSLAKIEQLTIDKQRIPPGTRVETFTLRKSFWTSDTDIEIELEGKKLGTVLDNLPDDTIKVKVEKPGKKPITIFPNGVLVTTQEDFKLSYADLLARQPGESRGSTPLKEGPYVLQKIRDEETSEDREVFSFFREGDRIVPTRQRTQTKTA